MAKKNNQIELSDQELISKIREDITYLKDLKEKYKTSCLKYLSRYSKKLKHITTEDIFYESCFELYKNIVQKDKGLTNNASVETYLNKICLNQLFKELSGDIENRASKSLNRKSLINVDVDSDYELIELEERLKMLNSNYKTTNPDWLPDAISDDDYNINVSQKNAIKNALLSMKADGGHCAELLVLFWWRKKSMRELTERYGYKNELTTKSNKAKCQKRLKIIMQKEL